MTFFIAVPYVNTLVFLLFLINRQAKKSFQGLNSKQKKFLQINNYLCEKNCMINFGKMLKLFLAFFYKMR